MGVTTITPGELEALRQAGRPIELIDVRTPIEYRGVHAEPARLVPLDALDPTAIIASRNGNSEEPLYLICRSGNRSRQACERFLAAGYANVVNVEGGTTAWERAGLPVVRGKASISIDRQVRMVVGSLVVLGTGLGVFVHPAFHAVSAVMGAGLALAGACDSCLMGMMLARMPWNQVEPETAPCPH